jgi:tRNA A-37 threonylcarbamoyl transferase component Bud32
VSEDIELACGSVRWQVRQGGLGPRDIERLFGPGGLRLAEWQASGAAHVVKQAPHRTVWHVMLPGLDMHLKHYPVADPRTWLRSRVRSSKARREYDRTFAVRQRGVPTFEPLAFGESDHRSASYLLTRTLAGAVPLGDFLEALPAAWSESRKARFRQRLAKILAQLLAGMHDAGVTHDDLHPGNILLQLDTADEPQLSLIDLHAVRLGPPLSWPLARANLVMLNRWFALRSDRADRLRFWHAYQAARRLSCNPAEVVRDLEARTARSNLAFWHAHDRRCLGGNRHFRRVGRGAVHGAVVADLDEAALAGLLADPDTPFRDPAARFLKNSPTSSVVEFELPSAAGLRRVVYKRFATAGTVDQLAALVRPTAAMRSYLLGHGLRLRCLPTPRPLGVWHRWRCGLPAEGYLLTEKVPQTQDLRAFVDALAALPPCQRLRRLRRLVDRVARLVGLLHQRHLSHRDLKAANLLVSPAPCIITGRGVAPLDAIPDGAGREDHVWFIDLVGVRRHRKLRRRRRLQNLARLNASFLAHPALTRSDRLRFLRVYLRWGLHGRLGWKRWWRQVGEATQAKVRRNLRNGRPLT